MKIGCVPYGHAKPFGVSWKVGEVVWDHPKELVGRLTRGEVDLALVPVWEILTGGPYRLVDGLAVGSRGEVRSVAVFHDKPLEECGGISLTPHSMSSVQLWRVVSQGAFGFRLEEKESGEARLRIGDEALQEWTERNGKGVTDLGKAWWDWTGLPFVFAVWALRIGFKPKPGEIEKFREECLAGIANRAELAKGKLEKEYLTKCIRYELGREEKEGMAEFAGRSGLAMKKIEYL